MQAVVYSLSLAALTLLAFWTLKYFDKRLTFACGILFAAYVGLDDFATGMPSEFAGLRFADLIAPDARWNWSGKTYSLLLSVAVISGLGLNAKAVGLTWPRANIRRDVIVLVPLVLIGVVLGLVFKPSAPSVETITFQALMPGMAEELAYRGIAPALLLGLIRGRNIPDGIPWTVICIAGVPYALVHALGYSGGVAFSFDPINAAYIYSGGIIYGWLRFSSGSLLFPLLAHSLANVAFHLTAL